MEKFTGISIYIPTLDEQNSIKDIIDTILSECDAADISEFIPVYSPVSPAGYVEFLKKLPGMYSDVKIAPVEQRNKGFNGALHDGFFNEFITGSHVAVLGADFEQDPHDMKKIIAIAKQHPDVCILGSRRLRRSDMEYYPKLKNFFNLLFVKLVKLFFDIRQSDLTYFYQCIPVDILQKHMSSITRMDSFALAFKMKIETEKLPFIEFPTKLGRRPDGYSHLSFGYYATFMKEVFALIREKKYK